MKRQRLAMLAASILAACSQAGQPVPTLKADVIAIATDFPLNGASAGSGISATEGARYAVEQRRTIGKFRLVLKSFDDSLAGFPEAAKAAQNVQRMAADPEVLAMVGPYNSFVAAEIIPVASYYHLAIVSPSTSSNCLTLKLPGCQFPLRPGGENNFYRIASSDTDQARAMADLAIAHLSVSKVAVLSDGFAYGEFLADSFSQQLAAYGGTVVLREQFRPSTNDFSELLRRVKDRGGQAVYFGGAPTHGACQIPKEMQTVLPDAYFMGGDALIDPDCLRDAGKAADLRMIATLANPSVGTDPQSKKTVDEYTKAHHPVGAYTFAAYDSARILIDAIERAIAAHGGKKPSRQQVLEALAASHFSGATGTWSFDANGDATAASVSFYRVQAGTWAYWHAIALGR